MAYESESILSGSGTPNDTAPVANLITAGDWVNGALSSAGDVDYFKFTAKAGLLTLQTQSNLKTSTARWAFDLLDANGDFLRTLNASASGTLLAKKGTSSTQVVISGLSGDLTAGTKFTLSSSAADTTIYTIISVDSSVGSTSTVVVDKSFSASDNISIALDPAQLNAAGGTNSLQALIPEDGTYYIKVSALAWTDSNYALSVTSQPSGEVANNNSVADASDSNSRVIAGVTHNGIIDSASDVDYWLLTTAVASNFSIDFAGATGASGTKFRVSLYIWTKDGDINVLTPAKAAGGLALDKTIDGSGSLAVDSTVYPQTNTFVVKVAVDSLASGATAAGYSLKASGAGLDLNDAPVIQVGSYSSLKPLDLLNLTLNDAVVHVYPQGASTKVALSSVFSAKDADAGQSLTYKVWLLTPNGSTASGSIKLEPVGGSVTTYENGAVLTEAQLKTANVYTGTALGDLNLKVVAIDSTNAPDNSGKSSVVLQTLRVVSDAIGIKVVPGPSLNLTEGALSKEDNYEVSVELSLKEPPTSSVDVFLVDSANQFSIPVQKFTFTTSNYATPQIAKIRANNDATPEGSNVAASLSFSVVSVDNNYDGMSVAPVTIRISDPANHAPTGSVVIPSADVAQGTAITASTASLADTDGLGNLIYHWQRSADQGANWSDIAGGDAVSYTPVLADALKLLRLNVTYLDGLGKSESVFSNSTNAVIKTNSAPTSADVNVSVQKSGARAFVKADFPFTDSDLGDTMSGVVIYALPQNGTLKLDGATFSVGDGYKVSLAELGKLVYTPDASLVGTYSASMGFGVYDSKGQVSSQQLMNLQVSTAPTAADTVVAGVEDRPITLQLSDFKFADLDSADTLQSVTITTLPNLGTLKLVNSLVTAGQEITATDIAAGRLIFSPAKDGNGANYANLKFKVSDGSFNSTAEYALTLNIAAVDDAPVFANVPTAVASHSAGQVFSLDDFTVADVDTTVLTLGLKANNGTLLGLGSQYAISDGFQIQGSAAVINAALRDAKLVGTSPGSANIALTLSDGVNPATTTSYAFTITAAANANDTDGDGLPNSQETRDGNKDGIADQYQANVASNATVTLVAESNQGVVPVDANTTISHFSNSNALGSAVPPTGMASPGVLAFDASVDTPAKAEHFSILVAANLDINGYWQKNSDDVWVNLASSANGGSITRVEDLTRLDFVITDGGTMDADHTANGLIHSEGLLGHLTPGLIGLPVVMPEDGFWF